MSHANPTQFMALRNHRSNTRKALYTELGVIMNLLLPLTPTALSEKALNDARIKLHRMDLTPEETDASHPKYCEIFSARDLDKVIQDQAAVDGYVERPAEDQKYAGGNYYMASQYAWALLNYVGSQYDWSALAKTHWVRQGHAMPPFWFEGNFYEGEHSNQRYGVSEILLQEDKSQPHAACILCDDAPANDKNEGLRGSEVFCALSLTRACIRYDKGAHFLVHPVYVYSFSDYRVRVLELAYEQTGLEERKLIVRKTEYADLRQGEAGGKKIIGQLMRWMMSTPTGKTKFPTLKADSPASKRKSLPNSTSSPIS